MEFEKVLKLIEAVSASGLTGFTLEENGTRLILEKRPGGALASPEPLSVLKTTPIVQAPVQTVPQAAVQAVPQAAGLPSPEEMQPAVSAALSALSGAAEGPAAPVEAQAAADGRKEAVPGEEIVKAPLVGTFYSAPSEDAAPFVSVGDTVKKGQVLGIIEAMKLMNEIESEYDGVVEAVLISNEQVVEYGQPLFRIRRKG